MQPKPGRTYIEKDEWGMERVLVVRRVEGRNVIGFYWHFDDHATTACHVSLIGFDRRFELAPIQVAPEMVV